MSTADIYISGIKKKLKNYYATWLPNEKLKLGDVGILDGILFSRVTTLDNLGISFTERPDKDSAAMDYVSESGVSLFFKAAGDINTAIPNVPQGKAGLGVEFSHEGAFILKAPKSHQPSIENIVALEQDLRRAYQKQRWRLKWAVIIRLVQTPVVTILISNSSNSKLEFAVDGDVSAGGIDLGSAGLKFELKGHKGEILKYEQAKNLTPMFQLARLKKRWLRDPSFSIRSMRNGIHPTDALTPSEIRTKPGVADSLYLDLVTDDDLG